MQAEVKKKEVVKQLQAKINRMQGLGKSSDGQQTADLAPFSYAFPRHEFPVGAVHEFISYEPAHAASTSGFITALAGKLMKPGSLCLWIGNNRKIFPSAVPVFGLEPDRIVFINTPKQRDALWILEEALKCEALAVVVGEIKELGFTDSRRLQLAVERSGVTGFIHRHQPFRENAVACTTRWKIVPLPSMPADDLPGIGHSGWDVQLLKVKNGRPASWSIIWNDGHFLTSADKVPIPSITERQTG